MFTVKHTQKADGVTHVVSCESYDKLPIDDLGRAIPQLNLRTGNVSSKMILEHGDVVYIENIKGKTIDVVKAPAV